MPKITNTTVIKHAEPICRKLQAMGKNWNWEAQAAMLVRVILEESGNQEMLSDDFKNERKEWANIIVQFGYPKNAQNSYLAQTNGSDGKPLMDKVVGTGKDVENEFVWFVKSHAGKLLTRFSLQHSHDVSVGLRKYEHKRISLLE